MTAEERLEKLERELAAAKRRVKQLLAGVGLAAGLALIVGSCALRSAEPKVVRARQFILVDEKGAIRATLTADEDRSGLYLNSGNGLAALTADKDGTSLRLSGGTGRSATLMADEDRSGLTLDNKLKPRAILSALEGGSELSLLDENGKFRSVLVTDEVGPRLALRDENGKLRASLGITSTQTPDGKTITYPESSLILFGEDGTVTWQAPR